MSAIAEARLFDVTLNGVRFKARRGDRIENYLHMAPHPGKLAPLGAIMNNRLESLARTISGNATARTVDYGTKEGAFIYRRTCCLILYAAVRRLWPEAEVHTGQSIHHGYFFELSGKKATPAIVRKIGAEMERIVADNVRIETRPVYADEAVEILTAMGHMEKVRYVTQMPRSRLSIVELLGFFDLLRGPIATATGSIRGFSVEPFRHGFIVRFPLRNGKPAPPPEREQAKLFDTMVQTRREDEILGVSNVPQLIDACVSGQINQVIEGAEALFKKRIVEASALIEKERKRVRVILIAGPSSSGKTTFSRRLATYLRILGIRPVTLSMDNYYVNRELTPKHPDGSYDFEHIEALDIPLFNEHLKRLIDGQDVESPIFDFLSGQRVGTRTIPLRLESDQVLIMEGIHALNDRLHELVPAERKYKVFVSALTQLMIDQHNRVFTSDTRLVRRIVRDRLYRGYSAAQTIHTWASVRAGEERYIFPFQEDADLMFNTALVYEHAVLTTYAKRFLLEVPQDDPAWVEAHRLYEFLDLFLSIFPEEVPRDSVLREFIGGQPSQY
ncbi:nucleoside kinase [bacterium]|nr:nucleoside kinase [bacterium]